MFLDKAWSRYVGKQRTTRRCENKPTLSRVVSCRNELNKAGNGPLTVSEHSQAANITSLLLSLISRLCCNDQRTAALYFPFQWLLFLSTRINIQMIHLVLTHKLAKLLLQACLALQAVSILPYEFLFTACMISCKLAISLQLMAFSDSFHPLVIH